MAECQAVRNGFSVGFRHPAVFVAELAWRWAFTFAAWLLIAYGALLFFKSVPVSDSDMFGLSGIIPGRFASTILHILAGSGPKIVRLVLALLFGVSFLSWVAYSVGRTAVLRALLSRESAKNSAMLRLNLLRTICMLLVSLAYTGCTYLFIRSSSPQDQVRPVSGAHDFSLLFAALAFVLAWLWGKLDGRLTLAGFLTLRDGAGVMDSIVHAADVSLRRIRQFAWIGLVFGFIRLILAAGAFFCALVAFGIFGRVSTPLSLLAVLGVMMVYSALTNFIGVCALAAQVRVIEWDASIAG